MDSTSTGLTDGSASPLIVFVPAQPAISSHPDKRERAAALSRIIYARDLTPDGRPSLQASLRQLVDDALEAQVIQDAPSQINVVGFGLRFDLGALGDFRELKTQIDSVSGKVATVGAQASMVYARTLMTGDILEPEIVGLHFIDLAAHVAPGTALRALGKQLGKAKLTISAPYSIERMDEYLAGDRAGFEAYAMRDAEIAVLYALRLADFAKRQLGVKTLPATASGLALKWCLKKMDEAGLDRLQAFGLHRTTTEAYHAPTKKRRTIKSVEPTPMRRIQEAFLTDFYAGGRNESFFIGPSPVGVWRDYDLAGAYSTGLVDMPLIDFENPQPSLKVEDYLGHVAGFALVEFAHPDDTRFPVFAVSRGGKGLIFPLKGTAYATAAETRGQLTGLDLLGQKIVLAKAGVQVAVEASNDLDGEAYKRLQSEKMLNLYLDRRPGKKILLKQFPAIREQWEKGIDLFKFEKRLVLSLEPDLKRAPCNPRMIDVASRKRSHISLDTRPWATVEEFDSARATLDAWRRKRCLKTMAGWRSLDEAIALNLIRSRLRTEGKATLNVREGMPASDLLRRAFLRAYAHEALGLTKTYSYPALARWLTGLGYPTKASEPRSAKSQEVVLGCVPRTEEVMVLFERLQAEFPGAELERLLAAL